MSNLVESAPMPGVDAGQYLSPDVVKALEDVQYSRGFVAGQEDIFNVIVGQVHSLEMQVFEEMKRMAEIFYQQLIKVVPESGIIEHRMGWDVTTNDPATLTIISSKHSDKMAELTDLASTCEMEIFDTFKYNCYFWVMTDEKQDRFLIEQDFPYVRKG